MCWKEESFLIIERKELRHAVPLVLSARLRSSLIGSNKARVTTAILHHSSLLYETPVTSQKPTFHPRQMGCSADSFTARVRQKCWHAALSQQQTRLLPAGHPAADGRHEDGAEQDLSRMVDQERD